MTIDVPDCGWVPRIDEAMAILRAEVGLEGRAPRPLHPAPFPPRFAAFLDLLVSWNRRLDLTAARTAEELLDLFLADAFVLNAWSADPQPAWVDVGTGAGAPGLVLALLDPLLRITLVEPRAKRVAFLRTAIGAAGLQGARVERTRLERLPSAEWDVSVSRATLSPVEWLQAGARLARAQIWVLLARAEVPSLDGWQADLQVRYHWPFTRHERVAVRYVRDPRP